MKTTKKVNTKELNAHAFDVMMLLKAKAIEVDEAKAQAQLLKQTNNLYKYELEKGVAYEKYPNIVINDIDG